MGDLDPPNSFENYLKWRHLPGHIWPGLDTKLDPVFYDFGTILTLALVCTCSLSSRFPDFHSYQPLFTI